MQSDDTIIRLQSSTIHNGA